jgi:EAL domain-containing protein (putative c-di-GMP-specific phosphodiesterase class I)
VLEQIVKAWLPLLDPGHVLARPGGDRFAVLLPDATEDTAFALTELLRGAISPGCSAGVTSWQPGDSASFMVGRADVALYRAKLSGGNRTVVESSGHAPLAIALAQAIKEREVDVLYQPVVDLTNGGKVSGVEALLRWAPPGRPDVTTMEVVRAAEESGLIAELDQYVLRRACSDALMLQAARNNGPLMLNVNVSGLGLAKAGFVENVDSALRETGWPSDQLVLEVTETVLDVDTPIAIAALQELRNKGVRIAIDDFGTGYSSLSRIQNLPSDLLKLDRSFIATIPADGPTPPLLRAIAILGIALGLSVVAEGVEDEHQAQTVKSLGYSFAQGFYYGRPQSLAEVINYMTATPTVNS